MLIDVDSLSLQVLSKAVESAGVIRIQSQSSRLSVQHSLDTLAGIREEIRIVTEETALVQEQLDTLLREVQVRRQEIERAKHVVSALQQEQEQEEEEGERGNSEEELTEEEQEMADRRAKTARWVVAGRILILV